MSSLYEINSDYENLLGSIYQEAEENEGEVGELLFDALDALKIDLDTKRENTALYIKNLLAEAGAIKAEEDNLASRRKSAEKKAERLKEYLASSLNGEKLKTARVVVSYRKSESVNIIDSEKVDSRFVTIKTTESISKSDVKNAIKAGEVVNGCELVTKSNMSIK